LTLFFYSESAGTCARIFLNLIYPGFRLLQDGWRQQALIFIDSGDPGVSAARASIPIVAAFKTGDPAADNALKSALFRTMDRQQRKNASLSDHLDRPAAARAGAPICPIEFIMVVCHRLGSFQDWLRYWQYPDSQYSTHM
jgi:hypothetical protein